MRPRRSVESPTCSGLAVGSDCARARPTEKIRARHTTTLAGRFIVQASSYSGGRRHSKAEGRGCQCEEPRGLDRAPVGELGVLSLVAVAEPGPGHLGFTALRDRRYRPGSIEHRTCARHRAQEKTKKGDAVNPAPSLLLRRYLG